MPAIWFALKRSWNCKSLSDAHDPKDSSRSRNISKSGCSRSIANLKDVIHGSKRHLETSSSPRSMASNVFSNPLKHEGHHTIRRSTTHPRKVLADSQIFGNGDGNSSKFRSSYRSSILFCQKCGESCKNLDAVEAHHLSKHAVAVLAEGESSRKIVEIICRTSMLISAHNLLRIEKVLKVHNTQKAIAEFEDYREMVKIKASKLSKKHPRCLADGNELLRFYSSTIACSLGVNGSSGLCILNNCGVCQILRHGFSINKDKHNGGGIGVFTTSTCGRAIETVELNERNQGMRKALVVCRVIAGRVHKPVDNFQGMAAGLSGFDSLVGKVDPYYNIEELYLLNPKALLPCFVVIFKLKHYCSLHM
ncbi:Zinc finger, C2H2 protein [Melia azedarach]|uniref:Zinc finger, C2H2 protein n=1 Tax=Melia azedarach TaxID=155640 RepID=A0ACC1WXB1_MELAZ|nr:Zinc finger, C2H2 protein [Melia azedarach]